MTIKELEICNEILKKYKELSPELIKKHSPPEFKPLDDGEERISRVVNFLKRLTSPIEPEFHIDYIPESLNAVFHIELSDIYMKGELLKELYKLSDITEGFYVLPMGSSLVLTIDVRYFKGDKCPEELAVREIIECIL